MISPEISCARPRRDRETSTMARPAPCGRRFSTMVQKLEGELIPGDARIAIVVSRFNEFFTSHMLSAAVNTFHQLGGEDKNLTVAHVPGSFELPVTALQLARTGEFRAIVCLGCVIRGETDHYDHVVEQTAKGIREVGTSTGIPCIFGVITCDDLEQAINRAGAKMGNQGQKAMLAAIEMANLMKKVGAKD
jgi:6,7-dimethyl-8-ribityllumazine synthase